MKRQLTTIFTLALLSLVGTASADDFRVHGSTCVAKYSSNTDTGMTGNSSSGMGRAALTMYDSTTYVMCPVLDTTQYPKEDHEKINVHYHRGSTSYGSSTVRACINYYNVAGGACGSSNGNSGSTGLKTATLDRVSTNELYYFSSGTNASHFGFVGMLHVWGSNIQGLFTRSNNDL